ncbi:MAG TPA: 50S ribosomal protein L30 [Steroidobacteraceae bacterium]|jgi:large subunit ribosomal protein L30
MANQGQMKVTLIKSLHGQLANIAQSARGLGLRKIRQTVTVKDTPENRGMIQTAVHLLKVEK